jgi:hypothetical protein
MSDQKTSFVPLAPVRLVKTNGKVRAFGLGASSDSARGTALAAALAAWQNGDHVVLGPGTFTLSAGPVNLTLEDSDVFSVSGAGPLTTVVKKTYAGLGGTSPTALYISGSCQASFSQIAFENTYTVFVAEFTGSIQAHGLGTIGQGFDIDNGVGGRIDWFGGFVIGEAYTITASANLYNLDFLAETDGGAETLIVGDNSVGFQGTTLNLYGCTIRGTGTLSTAIRIWHASVTVNLHGCTIQSNQYDAYDDGEGATVSVDAATEFDAVKISVGTFTRRKSYGITPTSAGLALLDDTDAAGQRATLGNVAWVPVQFNQTLNLADGASYYWACTIPATPHTAGGARQVPMPAGRITGAIISFYTGNSSVSSNAMTLYVRVNDTTDYLVSNSLVFSASIGVVVTVSNFAMDVPLSAGDKIEMKLVCPTWATNPTGAYFWGGLVLQ